MGSTILWRLALVTENVTIVEGGKNFPQISLCQFLMIPRIDPDLSRCTEPHQRYLRQPRWWREPWYPGWRPNPGQQLPDQLSLDLLCSRNHIFTLRRSDLWQVGEEAAPHVPDYRGRLHLHRRDHQLRLHRDVATGVLLLGRNKCILWRIFGLKINLMPNVPKKLDIFISN